MVGWLHRFGPEVRQSIMEEGEEWSRAAHLMAAGSRDSEKGKDWGRDTYFQEVGHVSVTHFLQLHPTSWLPPPTSASNYDG
jgi:hypothetical protein